MYRHEEKIDDLCLVNSVEEVQDLDVLKTKVEKEADMKERENMKYQNVEYMVWEWSSVDVGEFLRKFMNYKDL